MERYDFSRRQFLRQLGWGITSLSVSNLLAACQPAAAPPANGGLKDIAQKGSPAPAQPPTTNGIPITSNDDFYAVNYSTGDVSIPANWKLKIAGLVNQPLELSLEELRALPAIEQMRTFECISNPIGGELISNAVWKGVRLKDLLSKASVGTGAKELKLEAFDGFYTSIPIELALQEESLLAYQMNGVPLPTEHGAPLRCIWPGRYGMKQPKWIQTLTVIPNNFAGFWEKQGWTNDAFVLPNSRIDSPKDLAVLTTPTFEMSGVAFSGEAGIDRIDISWDDRVDWRPAELTRGPSPYVWTIWKWSGASLPAGRHSLYVRVTTKDGKQQSPPQSVSFLGDTFPNGTDQMHSVVVDFKS
jgi:DMSO/TMAO reductase YedYZ molybdopterin-dependent catalytic subunit